MSAKKWFREYLYFSRKDRIGAGVLLLLVILVFILPSLLPEKNWPDLEDQSALQMAADSLSVAREAPFASQENHLVSPQPQSREERFPFDPNTLDEAGWIRLGLPANRARTILRYREKGGRFRKAEDLARIWGLPAGFYEAVQPFIRIAPQEKPAANFREPAPYQPAIVEVNTADSAAWEALPGIGEKLAMRIVKYREKLGGFYGIEQVGEVYGLPDSVFRRITPRLQISAAYRRIRINTVTEAELKNHPYVRYKLARLLVAYREQHGAYKQFGDLEAIAGIDAAQLTRLKPYLDFTQ